MAVTTIVTGGAHSSETGGKIGIAGDQEQNSSPDYSGEVSMRSKTELAFKATYLTYVVYRLVNPDQAADAAELMIRACNNAHIGYSQTTRQEIFEYGVDSTKDINCDCSSLVSYCLSKATGKTFNTNTTGLGKALPSSGLFMNAIAVTSMNFSTNPPYNGDVLLRPGSHVEMVVAGNPRTGSDSEITAGTWMGDGNALQQYSNAYGTSYIFAPRKTSPTVDNMYYQQTNGVTTTGSYAWGRFSEIMRSYCNLSRGIPCRWYVNKEDGYKRGTAPLPGAIMCFTNLYDLNDPGVVCVVEEVNPNSIGVSWRHPRTGRFEFSTWVKDGGTWDLDVDKDGKKEFHCQGFIYNPAVNVQAAESGGINAFVKNAKAQIGNDGSYIQKYTEVVPKRDPWAAAFIVAVAKETGGILDICIPNTYACSNIGRYGVTRDMGTWFDGPAIGGNPSPHAGDIALFRTTALSRPDDYRYGADKAGIVVSVGMSTNFKSGKNQTSYRSFDVVMGDCSGKVKKETFATNSRQLSGLFRPNWDKMDGYSHSVRSEYEYDGMYTEGTSMEDAMMRDLRYVKITSHGLEPSIKSSGMTLSAINYTGMLANFYTAFVESGTSPGYDANTMTDNWSTADGSLAGLLSDSVLSTTQDLINFVLTSANSIMGQKGAGSGTVRDIIITPTVQTIYNTLNKALGNSAAAIGILGNILQENGKINPGAISGNGATGLCQWMGGRASNMKTYCDANGGNFANNVSGQVGFILKEVENDLPALKKTLQNVPDTIEGAMTACDQFMRKFERCGNYGSEGADRSTWTQGYWKLLRGE